METSVEKVQTGAIVIIAGEYIPVDKANHEISEELIFLVEGETAPYAGDDSAKWKLVEMYDFAT